MQTVTYPPPVALTNKKVLVVSESLGPINGVTRATQAFLDYLARHQIETAALAPRYDKDKTSNPADGQVPVMRLKGFPLLYNPDLLITYPFRMSKVFRQAFRPDVVYLASPATVGMQVWWQLRKSGIPLIANFQTDLGFYSRLMLPKLLGKPAGWSIDRLTGLYYRSPAIKAILCPSDSSQQYLIGLGVKAAKLRLVGRGVDCILFDPARRSQELRQKLAPNGEVLLLCVSRVSLEKGFDFLAQTYAEMVKLARQQPDMPKFRLIVTGGNTNQQIEQNIKALFEKQGLDVVFTGPLTGVPLGEIYASADIFVFPSVTETFGQVIQEAMASGLPVVARRQGGPADLVLPDETGYLAEPADSLEFASHTLKLIQDAEKRTALGQHARTLAEGRTWEAINHRITEILAEFVG